MSLADRQCKHISPGTPPLSDSAAGKLLAQLSGWSIEAGKLTKTFSFGNHYETTAFLNAVVWISHKQDHHPDVSLGYNKVTIKYDTHTVKGLSENDFVCAGRVERLFL
jgi:4a-hydroxytetrahydrobiopterin dehydratase